MAEEATVREQHGVFLTLEGGEGVGKSTLIALLSKWLAEQNIQHELCREPGGTYAGEQVRAIFNSSQEALTPQTELFLISASRAMLCHTKIKPLLEAGVWILSDRFYDSTRVYQGTLGNLSREFIDQVIEHATQGLTPNLTFLLDCPAEVNFARLANRSSKDGAMRYDQADLEQHRLIRQAFLELSREEPKRFVIIDGTLPLAEQLKLCQAAIHNKVAW